MALLKIFKMKYTQIFLLFAAVLGLSVGFYCLDAYNKNNNKYCAVLGLINIFFGFLDTAAFLISLLN